MHLNIEIQNITHLIKYHLVIIQYIGTVLQILKSILYMREVNLNGKSDSVLY